MNTASGVYIIRSLGIKMRPVGVSGDEGALRLGGIEAKTLFNPVLMHIIFGGAGRVKDAEAL